MPALVQLVSGELDQLDDDDDYDDEYVDDYEGMNGIDQRAMPMKMPHTRYSVYLISEGGYY